MNTQLALRTEFSLRSAYGRIEDIVKSSPSNALGICDRASTYGHVRWKKVCEKHGKKALYGVELAVVPDMDRREGKKVGEHCYMRFIAMNNEGLQEIYEITSLATEKKFYVPRIDYDVVNSLSENVVVLAGVNPNLDLLKVRIFIYFEISPSTNQWSYNQAKKKGFNFVTVSQNYYPTPDDKGSYEILAGGRGREDRTRYLGIIDSVDILPSFIDRVDVNIGARNSDMIALSCDVTLPIAEMVKPKITKTLIEMCHEGAEKKGVDLTDEKYKARLNRELGLIKDKGFEDYFYVVADIVQWSKQRMLIGVGRGSAGGSLVCHLLNITDVDPVRFDLLFERFIDINRNDYPDIDIDFPDHGRQETIEYIQNKYGHDCVAILGTVSKIQPKTAIIDTAREMQIPRWVIEPFKDAVDEDQKNAVSKAFSDTLEGQSLQKDHPEMVAACELEGHIRQSGVNAAGVLVTNIPIASYCSHDHSAGCAMIDKYDAEDLNMLKIDVLGLRTLTVIEECLDMVGLKREDIERWSLDDEKAFKVLNDGNFAGIFQFEGDALKNVCRQMEVKSIEDVSSLTALCRPGALASGGANTFLKYHNNPQEVEYFHDKMKKFTSNTFGVLVYQEQVMWVAKELGGLTWERVSALRKAISKSMGADVMDGFRVEFEEGCKANGMDSLDITLLWQQMVTMGGYAFNRSHAVAYAIMSYWCMVLKAHYPLEFACATLRHPKNDDQSVSLLRDVVREGVEFVSVCPEQSEVTWSIKDGKLIGGFKGLKGVGEKMAQGMIEKRNAGKPFTKRQLALIEAKETPWANIFDCHKKWGHILDNPLEYSINSKLYEISDIPPTYCGEVVILGRVESFTKRDLNEAALVARRGKRIDKEETRFLQFEVGDDTGKLKAILFSDIYKKVGLTIINGRDSDYYIVKGKIDKECRSLTIERALKITGHKGYVPKV